MKTKRGPRTFRVPTVTYCEQWRQSLATYVVGLLKRQNLLPREVVEVLGGAPFL